jgi:hypothetical protein
MEKTTVQISKKTMERLKTFKRHPRESYDEILNTLMDENKGKSSRGNARELLQFAGTISSERGEEMLRDIKAMRELARKRSL